MSICYLVMEGTKDHSNPVAAFTDPDILENYLKNYDFEIGQEEQIWVDPIPLDPKERGFYIRWNAIRYTIIKVMNDGDLYPQEPIATVEMCERPLTLKVTCDRHVMKVESWVSANHCRGAYQEHKDECQALNRIGKSYLFEKRNRNYKELD